MGRDLSTTPPAFHSDTLISAPLRSALHLPRFKPSPLFSLPLYISTSSLPYLTITLSSRPDPASVTAHYCFKSFRRNTYGCPRKCCKQKTYGQAKLFRCNTYKKWGSRPSKQILFFCPRPVRLSLPPVFRTLFQVPYPATSLSATLAKTAGCVPTIPILELDLCARQPYSLIPYPLSIPRLVVSCG